MIPEALIDQIRVCAAQNRQVRQQYSKRKKEEAAGRNRGRVDEFQGRRHPEERLLLSVTGQGACQPMASILLNRQRGHSAPLMLCPSEGSHYAVPCSSVKSGALYNASQPGEPRRTAASSLWLQRQEESFPLCSCSARQNDAFITRSAS